MKRVKMAIMMMLLASLAGCTWYSAKGVVPQNVKDDILAVKMEKEDIRVTTLSITRKADAKKYFDKNIVEEDMLAFWVNIDNEGEYPVRFASADLKVGKEIVVPMNTYEVYKTVKKGAVGKAFFWSFPGFLLAGVALVGTVPSVIHTSSVNSDIEKDIREKALLPVEIKPREQRRGFIWFKIPEEKIIPEGNKIPKGMILSIEVIKKGRSLEFDLPITL